MWGHNLSTFSGNRFVLLNIYGALQSKQSRAPEKWRIFFLRHPLKIAQICFFPDFFYIFPLIFGCKLQKIWFSGWRCYLGCAPYAQSWVSQKKFSIFQVLGTVYFAVCHIHVNFSYQCFNHKKQIIETLASW